MKILDKGAPTKNFSELELGEVFKAFNSVFMKINHCFTETQIEDFLDYEGSMYSVDELIDNESGYNAVNLASGTLTHFDDFHKTIPINTELHVL